MLESIKYFIATLFIMASMGFAGYMTALIFTVNDLWSQIPVLMVAVSALIITGMMVMSFINEPNQFSVRYSKRVRK